MHMLLLNPSKPVLIALALDHVLHANVLIILAHEQLKALQIVLIKLIKYKFD
jgi:hypothetical protein